MGNQPFVSCLQLYTTKLETQAARKPPPPKALRTNGPLRYLDWLKVGWSQLALRLALVVNRCGEAPGRAGGGGTRRARF